MAVHTIPLNYFFIHIPIIYVTFCLLKIEYHLFTNESSIYLALHSMNTLLRSALAWEIIGNIRYVI